MTYTEKLRNPHWQKKRLEILSRDNFMCQRCCADNKTLNVHHIAYFDKDPWDIEDKYLLTLCEKCHKEEQDQLQKAKSCLIQTLKESCFTSASFRELSRIFEEAKFDGYYSSIDFAILKMVLTDETVNKKVLEIYYKLEKKRSKKARAIGHYF